MKNLFIIILLLCTVHNLKAQSEPPFLKKTILQGERWLYQYNRSETFNEWDSPETYQSTINYMRVFNFRKPQKKWIMNYLHDMFYEKVPVSWDILGKTVYTGNRFSGFSKYSLVFKDTIEIFREEQDSVQNLHQKYGDNEDELLGKLLDMSGYQTKPFYEGSW